MHSSKPWTEIERSASWQRHSALWDLARAAMRGIVAGYRRSVQRRQLVILSDHQLRDIGVSRADVQIEWQKPFWRM